MPQDLTPNPGPSIAPAQSASCSGQTHPRLSLPGRLPGSTLARMRAAILALAILSLAQARMVMDEPSCREVEEEDCGLCHTVYMEECAMKEVEEMLPLRVEVCRREECRMEKVMKEEEVVVPVCSVKSMDREHQVCREGEGGCFRMMDCSMERKVVEREREEKVCDQAGRQKCYTVVKLQKQMKERKACSFHPKTVCQPAGGKRCRKVSKKMCNYTDTNQL